MKTIILSLLIALTATAANAERVAYRVEHTDKFSYIVELSDTKSELCGPFKARVLMSIAMNGSQYAEPFADGCWHVDQGSEEVVAELRLIDDGRHLELRNPFLLYTFTGQK